MQMNVSQKLQTVKFKKKQSVKDVWLDSHLVILYISIVGTKCAITIENCKE